MAARQRKHHWDRHKIKAEVHRRNSTLTQIAKNAGLSESSCRVALIASSPAGERALSLFLAVSLHELWPDRYDRFNRRLLSVSKTTRVSSCRTSQKKRAA